MVDDLGTWAGDWRPITGGGGLDSREYLKVCSYSWVTRRTLLLQRYTDAIRMLA